MQVVYFVDFNVLEEWLIQGRIIPSVSCLSAPFEHAIRTRSRHCNATSIVSFLFSLESISIFESNNLHIPFEVDLLTSLGISFYVSHETILIRYDVAHFPSIQFEEFSTKSTKRRNKLPLLLILLAALLIIRIKHEFLYNMLVLFICDTDHVLQDLTEESQSQKSKFNLVTNLAKESSAYSFEAHVTNTSQKISRSFGWELA